MVFFVFVITLGKVSFLSCNNRVSKSGSGTILLHNKSHHFVNEMVAYEGSNYEISTMHCMLKLNGSGAPDSAVLNPSSEFFLEPTTLIFCFCFGSLLGDFFVF